MTAATTTAGGGIDIGRVMTRTFNSVGENFANLLIITLVLVAIPSAAVGWVQQTFLASQGMMVSGAGSMITAGLANIVLSLVQLALNAAAQGAIFYFVVSYLGGRKAVLGDAISVGVAHWWPLWLVGVCTTFMTILAAIALFFPGIMLACRWIVALPVQVIENKGVFESMGRSAELTKGRRWSIFGLLLIVVILIWILEFALIAVFIRPAAGLVSGMSSPLFRVLFAPIIGLITTPLFSAGYASLYYELRSTREGVGVEALASVFD
jgi:hypothetical protein